jgi:hypothetical protein
VAESVSVRDAEAAKHHHLGYPVVLKPVEGAGGIGIRYCRCEADLEALFSKWPSIPQMIERYVPGTDVHLTFLSKEGEIVASEVHEPSASQAVRYRACRFYRDDQVLEIGRTLAGALRYTGIANLDFRRDRSGNVWLLECNPRLYRRVGLAAKAGVNFIDLGLDIADGHGATLKPLMAREQVVCNPLAVAALIRRGLGPGLSPRAIAGAVGMVLSDPALVISQIGHRGAQAVRNAMGQTPDTNRSSPVFRAPSGAGECPISDDSEPGEAESSSPVHHHLHAPAAP